jgi:glycine/serine hydroxymethyltransferase
LRSQQLCLLDARREWKTMSDNHEREERIAIIAADNRVSQTIAEQMYLEMIEKYPQFDLEQEAMCTTEL